MTPPSRHAPESAPGLHIATIAHAGIIWDTYLDFESDPHRPTSFRARLRFEPPTLEDGPAMTHTAIIIIEDSYEDAVARARSFDDRSLSDLLRSTLPEDGEAVSS